MPLDFFEGFIHIEMLGIRDLDKELVSREPDADGLAAQRAFS